MGVHGNQPLEKLGVSSCLVQFRDVKTIWDFLIKDKHRSPLQPPLPLPSLSSSLLFNHPIHILLSPRIIQHFWYPSRISSHTIFLDKSPCLITAAATSAPAQTAMAATAAYVPPLKTHNGAYCVIRNTEETDCWTESGKEDFGEQLAVDTRASHTYFVENLFEYCIYFH
jgi:hypothetical protein